MRNIIKTSQAKKGHSNPHYRVFAYAVIEGIVVLFGKTPQVDEDNPTIITDENKISISWKALIKEQWYGDYVTVVKDEKEIVYDEASEILFDQAKVHIEKILEK